jgi:NAD(P)-dependent dehydrogenase (short-subunit alcohol dehydrogenase family)
VNALDAFGLAGRKALVTGASRGLGEAMARGLAQAGADVAVLGRDRETLEAALTGILSGTDRSGFAIAADLSSRADAERAAREALESLGSVDILVNNAGANVPQPIDQITDDAWDEVLAVHVSSAMALTRALVPGMIERAWGRVIYTSSILGFQGKSQRGAYSAAKAALIGLVRSNAVDLGRHGVTANCIAPGPFITAAQRRMTPEELERSAGRTALGRWAEPDEVVGPLLLLASDAGSYITGTTLVVDGGWLAG